MSSTFDPPRAPRVPTAIIAIVTAGKRSGVHFTILNVSITGAKLEGPLSLALKETIKIRFEWEGTAVELAAEVVRVDSPDLMTDQIAARFIDVPEEAKAAIQDLVGRLLDAAGDEPEQDEDDDAVVTIESED
jgi:hypothetical protein